MSVRLSLVALFVFWASPSMLQARECHYVTRYGDSEFPGSPCSQKCCGKEGQFVCQESCVGVACSDWPDCDDNCCKDGKCTDDPSCGKKGKLIIILSVVFGSLPVFVLACLCRRYCHRVRHRSRPIVSNLGRDDQHNARPNRDSAPLVINEHENEDLREEQQRSQTIETTPREMVGLPSSSLPPPYKP